MSPDDLSNPARFPPTRTAGMRQIVHEVAARHGLPEHEVNGPFLSKPVARARQEAMFRARHELGQSWPQIGRFFRRHHATVIYGVRKHAERVAGQ